MDSQQFREFGKAAVDYIADYFDKIRSRRVLHSVTPGYLEQSIPEEVPQTGEPWERIMEDMESIIMPGITHWHHPNFYGYFLTGNSFPAVVGEIMSAGIASLGVNWMASPAHTELERAMMNWLGKLLHLPEAFLDSSGGSGGGVLQGSASESILLCLLAAKERKVQEILSLHPELTSAEIKGKLVAYCSDQANSSVEKSGLLGAMPMRLLPADRNGVLKASVLLEAIKKDKTNGFIPCYMVATIGTTPTCAIDDLTEIGPICEKENVWLHIDAAYAGAAFVCPEYRHLMAGIEYAESFNFNPHKWLLVNFDCSALWLKNAAALVDPFFVNRVYLQANEVPSIQEYRHWQIPLGRRFRALKVWFVLRIYGVEGLQSHIRKHVELAKYFEKLVRTDNRFEVVASNLGLVCFRFGDDEQTTKLLNKIMERGNLFVVGGQLNGKNNIRFAICSRYCEKEDIGYAWEEFQIAAEIVKPTKSPKKFSAMDTFTELVQPVHM